jgi:hypothetical protein
MVLLGVLAFGCGGKLTDGSSDGGSKDAGAAASGDCEDAGPLLGTWTCNYTSTPLAPPPPGATLSPQSGTMTYTFAANADGTLSLTLGGLGDPDGSPDAPPTCAGLTFTVEGDTATLDGQQLCRSADLDDNVEYITGTFSVSGCNATLSDLEFLGTETTSTNVDIVIDKASGTCTRN